MHALTYCESCDAPITPGAAHAVHAPATSDNPYPLDFCSLDCALAGIRDRRREVEAIRQATGTHSRLPEPPRPPLWNPYDTADSEPSGDDPGFIVEDRRH